MADDQLRVRGAGMERTARGFDRLVRGGSS